MKLKILIMILLAAFVSNFAQVDRTVQPKAGPAPEIKFGKYESFTLDNGLKVFLVENHKVPKINFRLMLNHDPYLEKENVGVSDLAGSLLGKGTKTKTKEEIDEAVDFIGASFTTSGNGISASSLTKHFDELLQITVDVLFNPAFKQEEFDKIKTRTMSGLAAAKEEPNKIAQKVVPALIYGKDHPYGEVFTEETLESITVDMCKDYVNNYFRPNNSLMAIVGDINKDEAKKYVEKYFGDWKAKEVVNKKYETPQMPEQNIVAISDRPNSVQSVISVAYPIELKVGSEDAIKAKVLNTILGGGFSSRLNQNLREKHAFTYGAGSRLSSDKFVGSFLANSMVRNEVTDSAVQEILNEMNRLKTEKVTEEELQMIKNYISGSFGRSLENPETIARFAINSYKYNLPDNYYQNYLKKLEQVTADDILEMAKKYLHPDKAHIIIVGNAKEIADGLKKYTPTNEIKYYDIYANEYDPTKASVIPKGVTAQTVIEKYYEALGGKDKILNIKDSKIVMKAKMQGTDITLTLLKKEPNKLYQEIDFGSGKQVVVFDGTKGEMRMMGQKQTLGEDKLSALDYQARIAPLLDPEKNNIKLELAGMEKVDGKDAYNLIVTLKNGDKINNYFDVNTGLKIKEKSLLKTPQGNFNQEIIQEDYKEFDGILTPTKIIQVTGPERMEMVIDSVEYNIGLNDSKFEVK
ncbi:MAG: peptidase M16 [Ignavibacteriae bacterium]|nr:MAG: peptidase M16 [Ignavibacteriota bacterium]